MPCSDGGYGDDYRSDRGSALQARNDMLAKLLCSVGRAIKNGTEIPKEVTDWWDQHSKLDAKRGEPW